MAAVGAAHQKAASLALAATTDGSPLKAAKSLDGVDGAISSVKVDGLSKQLPDAIGRLHAAVPVSAVDALNNVHGSYDAAHNLLTGGPLSQLKYGRKLLNVTDEIVGTFEQELEKVAGEIFDPQTLATIEQGLNDLLKFASGGLSGGDLVQFLARHLIGVADDLLAQLNSEIVKAVAVLAPIAVDTLDTVKKLEQAARDALSALKRALDEIQASAATAPAKVYADFLALLDQLEATARALMTELAGRFDRLAAAVDGLDWNKIMAEYGSVLAAIDVGQVPTIDDAVAALTTILDRLADRVADVVRHDALPAQVDVLVQALDDTVATAGLRAARNAIHDAFKEVQDAIASVPTEDIQKGIDTMLGTVTKEVQDLNLAEITKTIKDGLEQVATQVAGAIDPLAKEVEDAVGKVVGELDQLPLAAISKEIVGVIGQARELVDGIADVAKSHLGEIQQLFAEFDQVSFKPLADEVIGEIDDVKARLDKIDSSALSAPERFAISAALTVLEAIDFEGQIIKELEAGFDVLRHPVDDALGVIVRPIESLGDFVGQLDPAKLVAPVDDLLNGFEKEIDSLDAEVLIKPLRARIDELVAKVGAVNPGLLLTPLEGPYTALVTTIGHLDPTSWVGPLNKLYGLIDQVIGELDITPLFDELAKTRLQLLDKARAAIVGGLAAQDLPAPVKAMLTQVTTTLAAIADAAFGDPHQLSKAVSPQIDLTTPLIVLDAPFNELVGVINHVPPSDLASAANTLREAFGPGLDALDPRSLVAELRAGYARLAALDPSVLLAGHAVLPTLRAQFETAAKLAPPAVAADVAAAAARFAAIVAALNPGLIQGELATLIASYHRVADALGRSLNSLDPAVATGPYLHLRGDLERLVPAFLRQSTPLTAKDVSVGLETLRPSTRVPHLKISLDRFVGAVAPLEARIGAAFDQLLAAMSRALALVDPVAFKADVAAIYATVHAKVRIVDPTKLADSTTKVLKAALDQLKAIDPKQIGDELRSAYDQAFKAVSKDVADVLDTISKAIDAEIAKVKDAVKQVITEFHRSLDGAVAQVGELTKDVQSLVLVDIVGRVKHFTDHLATSLHTELERVHSAFDAMLDAIPLDKGSRRAAA